MKALLLAMLLAAGLAACGGGGSSSIDLSTPGTIATFPDAPETAPYVLFSQGSTAPVVVNDPGDESWIPKDVPVVATFDLGLVPITFDLRGVGLVNDSWKAPAGGKPIKAMNYAWLPKANIRPWDGSFGDNTSVCTSFKAAVPVARQQGSWGAYTGADIWLADGSTGKATSGKQIIVSGTFYVQGGQDFDGGPYDYIDALNGVQFRAPFGHSKLISTTAGALRREPWAEPSPFGFCITRDQALFMFAASVDLFGGMVDIHDVVVHQSFLSNETNLGVPSSTDPAAVGASLTSYFSDWTVFIRGAQ